jgi:hypothetical protein
VIWYYRMAEAEAARGGGQGAPEGAAALQVPRPRGARGL